MDLKSTDCKDLVTAYRKRHGRKSAHRARWVKDDAAKGPVYELADDNGNVVAHGWFSADGTACFVAKPPCPNCGEVHDDLG